MLNDVNNQPQDFGVEVRPPNAVGGGSSHAQGQNGQATNQQVLHEAIIDLYLQVKVRSSDEIDRFG